MKQITFTLILLLSAVFSVYATTYTSVTNGDWNDPNTWSPAGVPNVSSWPGDEVNISHAITFNGNLTMNQGSIISIINGGQLDVSGKMTLSSGHTGTLEVASSSFFNVNGTFKTSSGSNTVQLNGTMNTGDFTIDGSATVYTDGLVLNAEKLTVSGSGALVSSNSDFTVSSVDVKGSGVFEFDAGVLEVSGKFKAEGSAEIEFVDSMISIGGKLEMQGSATIDLDQGELTVNDETDLKNSAKIYVDGGAELNLSDLTMKGSAGIEGVGSGGVLNMDSYSFSGSAYISCVGGGCNYSSNSAPPLSLDLLSGLEVLPVELMYFSAKIIEDDLVLLEWATALEENNMGFDIEYSKDGKDWTPLTFVSGKGSTLETTYYQLEDSPETGRYHYYRLTQVDYDGKQNAFGVKVVEMERTATTVSVYPNPFTEYVQIESAQEINGYRLIHSSGKVIENVQTTKSFGERIYMDATMTRGIYVLEITTDNGVELIKIIKN